MTTSAAHPSKLSQLDVKSGAYVTALLVAAGVVSGCGSARQRAAASPSLEYKPLVLAYLKALNDGRWTAACHMSPSRAISGFPGQRGCASRVRAQFSGRRISYEGGITGFGSEVGDSEHKHSTRFDVHGAVRQFSVNVGRAPRQVIVVGSGPGAKVFLTR